MRSLAPGHSTHGHETAAPGALGCLQASMYEIQGQWQAYQAGFKDMSVLGNFM